MTDGKLAVTFYHSVVCPRCHYSGHALRTVLRTRDDVEVTSLEILTHRAEARRDGVRTVPALVARGRSLAGFVLTAGRIERFLAEVAAEPPATTATRG
ncbi:MAG: hypothetical protein R2752_20805 [Vicinamibacterales bacterium]